jgi:hypothetical protein
MFNSFVPWTKIPENGNILARISDNVLDDTDWGVYKLSLKNGVVKKQRTINQGAYAEIKFVGMSIEQLSSWSRYDSTGEHPETYHELEVPND